MKDCKMIVLKIGSALISSNENLSENKLLIKLKSHKIDLILLAGYMKILSKRFIRSFRKTIINIHPSLLPKFKGLNTFEKVLQKREKKTGCTVHFVTEKLDDGKIILKKFFYIEKKDDVTSIEDMSSGNTYGNDSTTGITLGVGYNHEVSNGISVRAEVTASEFDDVKATNGQTNKTDITIQNMIGARGTISLVKSF